LHPPGPPLHYFGATPKGEQFFKNSRARLPRKNTPVGAEKYLSDLFHKQKKVAMREVRFVASRVRNNEIHDSKNSCDARKNSALAGQRREGLYEGKNSYTCPA
jgi:hypothetical protein